MPRKIIAIAILTLAGCAASGVKVTEEQIATLKPGVATETETVARFGPPTMRTRLGDGTVMLQYVYAEAKVRPATFIPIVGLFAGGSDVRSNAVMLRFGADGRLIDTTSSSSAFGTGTGLSAGEIAPVTDQPRR